MGEVYGRQAGSKTPIRSMKQYYQARARASKSARQRERRVFAKIRNLS